MSNIEQKSYRIRYVNRTEEEYNVEAEEELKFQNLEEARKYTEGQLSVSFLGVIHDHESDEITTRLLYKTEYYDKETGNIIPDSDFEIFDEDTMSFIDYYIEIEEID